MAIRVPDLRGVQGGTYAALDDRMLVLDFQSGHPEAFVEIHHRYGGLARQVCYRLLQNNQDADEAFQETWIRVFQGLHRFNGRYALQPWIAKIATNVSLDHLRTRTRRPLLDDHPIDEHEQADHSAGPEEAVERLVDRDLVLSVLSDLPEGHRRALVLREVEGRSHKEIAADLGISPGQAKALIHRAKGTFRREWLRKATERPGVMGILLIPFFWLSKAAGVARRLVDRAGEATQASGAEVLTHAVASPAVSVAATGMSERIVAAGLTLIVAGGVTVGAATIARHRADRPERAAVPPAAVVAPVPEAPDVTPSTSDDVLGNGTNRDRRERDVSTRGDIPPVVAPVPTPSTEPTPELSTEPSPPPSTEPSPPPTPVVPPAPPWGGAFVIAWTSQDTCDCGPGVEIASSSSQGSLLAPEGTLTVSQSFSGAALDAEGDAAWTLSAEYEAHLAADGGDVRLVFTLGSDAGSAQYLMQASSPEVLGTPGGDGPVLFVFHGSYGVIGSADGSPIPLEGVVTLRLSVWADGTSVYGVGLSASR